ncbi:MAG: ABC transporter ATP-binding protein [Spirochaetia bacterium]|jgi:iron complex transport system ATP-binding protein|nr:ABC transporter ATP-binding protein [Spirochaetia bacterium]
MSPYKPFVESDRLKDRALEAGTAEKRRPIAVPRDQASETSKAVFALEAEALSVGYPGRVPVISGLSFRLKRGRVLAVIGPNGSGKTTLFRALAGELPLSAGRVLVRGQYGRGTRAAGPHQKVSRLSAQDADSSLDSSAASALGFSKPDCFDMHKLPARTKARLVTRVLQNEQSAWAVPVSDYVQAGLFAAEGWFSHDPGRAAKKTAWALDAMGIAFLAKRPVTELSGGEFRRVVIARALVQDTDILLLDEPTADLDLEHQMETLELLLDLAKAGKAVAFSVHDLNQAAMVADRVLLLDEGRAAAYGKPSEVLTAGIIGQTYGSRVFVGRHPAADIPQIVPNPEWMDRVRAKRQETYS